MLHDGVVLPLVLGETTTSCRRLLIVCLTFPTSRRSSSIFFNPKKVMDHYCSKSCGLAASVGILSHVFYFVRGEHHQHALQFIQILFYGFFPSSFILARLLQIQYAQAMQLGALCIGSYFTALWMSMLIYRSFFHRLNSFPGPWPAKLSKFYQFFMGFRLDAFRRTHEAHQKYGNFVRTGKLILNPRLQLIRCGSSETCNIFKFPLHQEVETGLASITSSCNRSLFAKVAYNRQKCPPCPKPLCARGSVPKLCSFKHV